MVRRFVVVALISVIAGAGLTGCGKKGPLELPNGKTANPSQTMKQKDQEPTGFNN